MSWWNDTKNKAVGRVSANTGMSPSQSVDAMSSIARDAANLVVRSSNVATGSLWNTGRQGLFTGAPGTQSQDLGPWEVRYTRPEFAEFGKEFGLSAPKPPAMPPGMPVPTQPYTGGALGPPSTTPPPVPPGMPVPPYPGGPLGPPGAGITPPPLPPTVVPPTNPYPGGPLGPPSATPPPLPPGTAMPPPYPGGNLGNPTRTPPPYRGTGPTTSYPGGPLGPPVSTPPPYIPPPAVSPVTGGPVLPPPLPPGMAPPPSYPGGGFGDPSTPAAAPEKKRKRTPYGGPRPYDPQRPRPEASPQVDSLLAPLTPEQQAGAEESAAAYKDMFPATPVRPRSRPDYRRPKKG